MKPRLLFLCQLLPYPPDGGAPIRTFNVLRQLTQHYDVTLLCFFRRHVVQDVDDSTRVLEAMVPTRVFPIEQEHRRARWFADHARSLITGRVYTEFVYESHDFRRALQQTLARTHFDVVHVDSLDLSGYLPMLHGLPVVCVHHNVESQLLARRAGLARNPATRWYLQRQASLMRMTEATWAPRVALNIMVSAPDAAALQRIAPGARCLVVPNGVDAETFTPRSLGPLDGLIYVGGLTWFPNRDALDHLVDDVLPALARRGLRPRVQWVGHATEAQRRQFAARGVNLLGYVDDVRPFVHRAACFVVPLRVGGGTRLKILDAWAMGKAVVSTSVGCEGLAAEDGVNILIRDDPDEFAAAVESVLHDDTLRLRLGKAARATVERHYAWPIIGETMQQAYASLHTPPTAAASQPVAVSTR